MTDAENILYSSFSSVVATFGLACVLVAIVFGIEKFAISQKDRDAKYYPEVDQKPAFSNYSAIAGTKIFQVRGLASAMGVLCLKCVILQKLEVELICHLKNIGRLLSCKITLPFWRF